MLEDLIILPSARRHGDWDAQDLRHVVIMAVGVTVQDDGVTMYVGPDRAGNLMEVGVICLRDDSEAIVHAMRPPRAKYIPRM